MDPSLAVTTPSPARRWGFAGRLTEAFPSQVLVDATEICNLSCTHCPHPAFRRSEHYGARSLDPELHVKLVDEVRDHGRGLTRYIRYASNGEPLVHPQIFEMMGDAARRSGVTVALTTNGRLLTPARAERLLEAGVGLVDVSLDAHDPATYARIRVGGDLVATRGHVLELLRRRDEARAPLKVVVSYVEQPENAGETSAFERFWRDHGADDVVIRRMHSCSGAMEGLAAERRDRVARLGRRPCLYPWERIVLNARGELGFCPSDWVHGSVIAPYASTTVKEVWSGAFYRGLRAAHLAGAYHGHPFCGQCPDWEATRWPDEGRSYADMVHELEERASA